RYSAISSGEAMRANSKRSLPMFASSGVAVSVVVPGGLPGDGGPALGPGPLLGGRRLRRKDSRAARPGSVAAARAGGGARGDAVQGLRRLRRRGGALELELLAVTHRSTPSGR